MYQQQYHTANYRGNIQNHDAYLRSDSQQPSSYAVPQSQQSSQVTSQYRGYQKPFQPSGYVQSFYQRQPQSQQFQQSYQPQFQQQIQQSYQPQFQQNQFQPSNMQSHVATSSYQTANYRGNQPGHDAYLRSDSTQPSQTQFSGMNQSFGISQQGFR